MGRFTGGLLIVFTVETQPLTPPSAYSSQTTLGSDLLSYPIGQRSRGGGRRGGMRDAAQHQGAILLQLLEVMGRVSREKVQAFLVMFKYTR